MEKARLLVLSIILTALPVFLQGGQAAAPTPMPQSQERVGSLTVEPGARVQGGIPFAWPLADGRLRLYYCGQVGAPGIASAVSQDGLNFTLETGSRVNLPNVIVCDPTIVRSGAGLRMYFKVGQPAPPGARQVHTVWSAVSSDGLSWQVEGQRLFLEAECANFVSVPSAVALSDGSVRLYFVCGGSGTASALSGDGLSFAFEGFVLDGGVDPDVLLLSDGTYRMFYTVWNPGGPAPFMPGVITTATSRDGLNWTTEGIVATAADFGTAAIADPSALPLPDGGYRLYLGTATRESGIVSAVWHPRSAQAGFTVCPSAGGWAMAVWNGGNNTPAGTAAATCTGVQIDTVFSFNTQDQLWRFFFVAAPAGVNTLSTLNNGQVVFLHGAGAPTPTPTPQAPTPGRPSRFAYSQELRLFTGGYADPSLIRRGDGTYLMYLNSTGRIIAAGYFALRSDDGIAWQQVTGVIFPGIAIGRAFQFPEGVRFYYPEPERSGSPGQEPPRRIVSSLAADGIAFQRDAGVRVSPRGSGYSVGGPGVIRLQDGTYRMFFDEVEVTSMGPGRIVLGEIYGASSTDGLSWSRDASPTIVAEGGLEGTPAQVLHPCLIDWPGGGYLMFYNSHGRLYAAYSQDGFAWEKLGSVGITGADCDVIRLPDGSLRIYFGRASPSAPGEVYTGILNVE